MVLCLPRPRPRGQADCPHKLRQPESLQISQPESLQISQPESLQISQPESLQISQPKSVAFDFLIRVKSAQCSVIFRLD